MESVEGEGSTFTFSFGAPTAPNFELVDEPERTSPEAEMMRPAPPAALRVPERILLAEDGLDNQRLISLLLKKAGADVVVVENGKLAIERLSDETFDLVLMDMAMPEIDGYEATRTLRQMGFELPIVALTAHALSGEKEKCIRAGCDAYLTKPVDRLELLRQIRALLDGTQKSERYFEPVAEEADEDGEGSDDSGENAASTSL